MAFALVSILGPDRVGLVAAVADYLFNAGVNLGDTAFATLGTGADFRAVCELPENTTTDELEKGLGALQELNGAQIQVAPYAFDPTHAESGRVTHRITIGGGDQLGLVARLSEVFRQYEANIVRLEARKVVRRGGRALRHPLCGLDCPRANRPMPCNRHQHGGLPRVVLSRRGKRVLTAAAAMCVSRPRISKGAFAERWPTIRVEVPAAD